MVGIFHFLLMYETKRHKVYTGSLFSLFFILCVLTDGKAQERCGTVEYTKMLQEKNLIREDNRKFEQWLSRKIQNSEGRVNANATFKIPVVVHVIHKGEAIGSGTNISDPQILSQINVLNRDFKRLNADTANTPSEFLSLAGKINLEFVMAKQTPDGLATNGIVRVKGTKSEWSINDNKTLKALSYWPAEDYLNIWITDIASSILGYAQFPVSDLPGLEDVEDNRLTDGIVLDYRIVGSNQDGSFNLTTNFNRGRTATHEVGHFFGLRHIWGDDEGACSGSGDYVEDTPDQGNNSDGCPSHPQISCNAQTMFQNYMDYTNDVCMNLYTKQQVERMFAVLENSPRRSSLVTSGGLYDPALVNNDLMIKEISRRTSQDCIGNVTPKIMVKNNGLNHVTSTKIRLTVSSDVVETKDVNFSSLRPQEVAEISFTPFTLSPGTMIFQFEILETNNTEDGKLHDNVKTVTIEIPGLIATPFSENFNSLPESWSLSNEDSETSWQVVQTGAVHNSSNKAAYMQFFQGQHDIGERDVITTPVIDLSQATSPFLAFDVAYGRYQNRSDGLEVHVLLNCNADLSTTDVIYSKYGNALATVSPLTNSFTPANENQWRHEVIDLRNYVGETHVQLAFLAISDNGNNLYLDNISLRTDVAENIAVKEITYPSPVHCNTAIQPLVLLENKGDLSIHSFNILYSPNNDASQTFFVSENFSLASGQQTTVTLPFVTLIDGENLISVEVKYPNGFTDIDTSDNNTSVRSIVNSDNDKIPLRNNFDGGDADQSWEIINPIGSANWETISTNYNQSLHFKGQDFSSTESEYSWLVSPVLDFSDANTASLFFDLAHDFKNIDSTKDTGENIFKVMASRDCGMTYPELLLSMSLNSLSAGNIKKDEIPASGQDWNHTYINLNTLAGEENVRIAFVVSSAITNTIYLDNIEFFLSDDPSPLSPPDLYTIYPTNLGDAKSLYVTFNLTNRQAVKYELVDMLGKQVGAKELTDVLNQTYKVDVENASNGMYLVRLLIDQKYYVSRIVVSQ
jgi:hypothetical protein